ncbi:condensin-2 complex subunit H2 [Panicum miliaceum]|uniref:Condensin-2 complex subunit H2 n=1 Tax=Panicum miliaceum TaxID=4540 RepID=A0A3L6T926_PANMI|nr:condensin-2 complex subunit H2 [Panicum miliaceum]
MDGGGGGGDGGSSGGRFPILQANRDPESNWEVDVAKRLEEYLLKICSGEVTGEDGAHSVNFAEAALLLQGSVQVYSRKVEYLYSLVLHALEFLSQKKQDQQENGSAHGNENDPSTISNEEDDVFMGLDDVPVEARISLDDNVDRDDLQRKNVRPPANLLVFEGDCLDSEASELDLYLLTTCDFYRDFLLLDPCDAPAVFEFLQGKCSGKENNVAHQGSSAPSKNRPSMFTSPNGRSGGTGRKSAPGKVQEDLDPTQESPGQSNANKTEDNTNAGGNGWSDPVDHGFPGDYIPPDPDDLDHPADPVGEDSDDEDPWKPLNPHEPGNLKIRPYMRVKGSARQVIGTEKKKTLTSLFPVAKMDGVTVPQCLLKHNNLSRRKFILPNHPLHMKWSFEYGEQRNPDVFGDSNYDTGHDIGVGFDDPDDSDSPICGDIGVAIESPTCPSERKEEPPNGTQVSQENLDTHESLDDLCRSHLIARGLLSPRKMHRIIRTGRWRIIESGLKNALLASTAEVEQQSEMDARVSTWKERIEHALEEQDKNPPFDIGSYGEQILDTLSSSTDNMGIASFSEIVSGRPKYEVARTFSALLQLVNGRSVYLDKGQATNELVCYTAENPFHVKLIGPNRRPETEARFARKRGKSPLQNPGQDGECSLAQQEPLKKPAHKNGKIPVKTAIRMTPDGKRRRRSAAHLMQLSG